MLPSHDRFPYSAITERPDFSWPDGKRLAVYVALCMEHFSYGSGGLGLSYSPGLPHPNTYNWAWREYGNRVGGWRLLELFERHDMPATVLVNSECYEHCPQLVAAYRSAGAELVAHGRTNSTHPNELDEEAERELIEHVYETMSRADGQPPAGWMSPGANPSAVTEDLLAETGFRYTLDWPMDDQPVWLATRGGPLLSIPYPHEVNDVPTVVFHHATADAFERMVIANLDEMVEQSARQPLVCGITIHTFIVGQPFRLRAFRSALEHLTGLRGVWLTTPGRIADHFAEIQPPPVPAA
ncbi:MAG TPA: polysaccharide deacetylase family protein [Gaiellaceae bacterium]|nr:polysaccharide deacetylase family protein [Gaiellaceae bacterium]